MKKNEKSRSKITSLSIALLSALMIICFSSTGYAEWSFGIGTGLSRLKVEGDLGFNTNIAGPVQFKVDLDPDDIDDVMSSAFGFGGYASDGTWMIKYSYGKLNLEDKPSSRISGTTQLNGKFDFDITGAELLVGYPVYKHPSIVVNVEGGVRYTKHELESRIEVYENNIEIQEFFSEIDENWTDGVIGASFGVPFSKKWAWNTSLNAGFGESEESLFAGTGVTWRFHKSWSTSLSAKYHSIEYEKNGRGSDDWYFYDAEETKLVLGFLYHF